MYHQNIILENRRPEVENKSFGLCLGDAPTISPDAFKGREDELQALHIYLLPTYRSGPMRVVSIVGTGGLGKTQLSLAYARAYSHCYSFVFWLSGDHETALRQSMVSLAKIVLPDFGDRRHQIHEAGKLAVERVRTRRSLALYGAQPKVCSGVSRNGTCRNRVRRSELRNIILLYCVTTCVCGGLTSPHQASV